MNPSDRDGWLMLFGIIASFLMTWQAHEYKLFSQWSEHRKAMRELDLRKAQIALEKTRLELQPYEEHK